LTNVTTVSFRIVFVAGQFFSVAVEYSPQRSIGTAPIARFPLTTIKDEVEKNPVNYDLQSRDTAFPGVNPRCTPICR
jgi:hypothetical protein